MTIKSLLKGWRLGLLLFGLALFASVAFVISRVDTASLVHVAARYVKEATGRELNIRGPVALKFLPNLSLVAEDVTLSNAPWAEAPLMVQADRVAFTLAWLPLLHERVAIDQVEISGVTVNLQAAPAQQKEAGNWILEAEGDESSATAESGFEFDLKTVLIKNANLSWRDSTGVQTQALQVPKLTVQPTAQTFQLNGSLFWYQQPLSVKGSVNISESIPKVQMDLVSDRLDLQAVAKAQTAGSGTQATSKAPVGPYVFNTIPLPFDLLPMLEAQLNLKLATLVLPSGVQLNQLSTRVSLLPEQNGQMTVAPFSMNLGKGHVDLYAHITGYGSKAPMVEVKGHARDFTMGQILAQLGKANELDGGPTQAAFQFKARGLSPRQLVSTMNGQFQISVGAATISSSLMNKGGDFLVSLLNVINPLSKSAGVTQLQCAVAYLPVQNGLVPIRQSVGMETDRLNVSLNGQINLKSEMLDLKIYPKEKTGLTTGVNAAGLVQIKGTLLNPQLGVNKSGVINQAATVGLAVFTGGISLAAQNVASFATRSSPCQNVLRPWSSVDGQLNAAN